MLLKCKYSFALYLNKIKHNYFMGVYTHFVIYKRN
jgi:hypothetical protein